MNQILIGGVPVYEAKGTAALCPNSYDLCTGAARPGVGRFLIRRDQWERQLLSRANAVVDVVMSSPKAADGQGGNGDLTIPSVVIGIVPISSAWRGGDTADLVQAVVMDRRALLLQLPFAYAFNVEDAGQYVNDQGVARYYPSTLNGTDPWTWAQVLTAVGAEFADPAYGGTLDGLGFYPRNLIFDATNRARAIDRVAAILGMVVGYDWETNKVKLYQPTYHDGDTEGEAILATMQAKVGGSDGQRQSRRVPGRIRMAFPVVDLTRSDPNVTHWHYEDGGGTGGTTTVNLTEYRAYYRAGACLNHSIFVPPLGGLAVIAAAVADNHRRRLEGQPGEYVYASLWKLKLDGYVRGIRWISDANGARTVIRVNNDEPFDSLSGTDIKYPELQHRPAAMGVGADVRTGASGVAVMGQPARASFPAMITDVNLDDPTLPLYSWKELEIDAGGDLILPVPHTTFRTDVECGLAREFMDNPSAKGMYVHMFEFADDNDNRVYRFGILPGANLQHDLLQAINDGGQHKDTVTDAVSCGGTIFGFDTDGLGTSPAWAQLPGPGDHDYLYRSVVVPPSLIPQPGWFAPGTSECILRMHDPLPFMFDPALSWFTPGADQSLLFVNKDGNGDDRLDWLGLPGADADWFQFVGRDDNTNLLNYLPVIAKGTIDGQLLWWNQNDLAMPERWWVSIGGPDKGSMPWWDDSLPSYVFTPAPSADGQRLFWLDDPLFSWFLSDGPTATGQKEFWSNGDQTYHFGDAPFSDGQFEWWDNTFETYHVSDGPTGMGQFAFWNSGTPTYNFSWTPGPGGVPWWDDTVTMWEMASPIAAGQFLKSGGIAPNFTVDWASINEMVYPIAQPVAPGTPLRSITTVNSTSNGWDTSISMNGGTGTYLDKNGNWTTPPGTSAPMVYPTAQPIAPGTPLRSIATVNAASNAWDTSITITAAATKYLKQDGTWDDPPGTTLTKAAMDAALVTASFVTGMTWFDGTNLQSIAGASAGDLAVYTGSAWAKKTLGELLQYLFTTTAGFLYYDGAGGASIIPTSTDCPTF
jgi:hypothetical protein